MEEELKRSYRVEKTVYQDTRKVIDKEHDKVVFTITFSNEISMAEKEEIMQKIHTILNS